MHDDIGRLRLELLGRQRELDRRWLRLGPCADIDFDHRPDRTGGLRSRLETDSPGEDPDDLQGEVVFQAGSDLSDDDFPAEQEFVGEGEVLNQEQDKRYDGEDPITEAVSEAESNETLIVGPGTYDESVSIGTEGLTLESAEESAATIEGEGDLIRIEGDEVVIDGFEIVEQPNDANRAGIVPGGEDITIENNVFEGFNNHIAWDRAGLPDQADTTIENNVFNNVGEGNAESGTAVAQTEGVDGLEILNNEFVNNRNDIGLADDVSDVTIEGNSFEAGDSDRYISNRIAQELDSDDIVAENTFDPDAVLANLEERPEREDIVPEPRAGEVLNLDTRDRFDGDDAIQEAANDADEGDTLLVGPSTYEESVTIDEDITLLGAQAGEDARDRDADESVITTAPGEDALIIEDSANVTLDGFHIDEVQRFIDTDKFGDIDIRNNKFTNAESVTGGYMWFRNVEEGATVEFTFQQNYLADSELSNGVRVRASNGEVDADISDNLWEDNAGWAFNVNSLSGTVSDNVVRNSEIIGDRINDNQWGMLVSVDEENLDDGEQIEVTGNEYENLNVQALDMSFGFDVPLVATGNQFEDINASAVNIREDENGENVTVNNNNFIDVNVGVDHAGDGTVDATSNWWGVADEEAIDALTTGDVEVVPFAEEPFEDAGADDE